MATPNNAKIKTHHEQRNRRREQDEKKENKTRRKKEAHLESSQFAICNKRQQKHPQTQSQQKSRKKPKPPTMFQRSSSNNNSTRKSSLNNKKKLSKSDVMKLLLEQQLGRYWVTLNGTNLSSSSSSSLSGTFSFLYNDIRVQVELAEDTHSFMVSCTVYQQSKNDDTDEVYEEYLRLERGISPAHADIRLEYEEGEELIVYQNVSMEMAQEEVAKEFENLMDAFLKEATKMHTALHNRFDGPAPSAPNGRSSPRGNGWRRKSSTLTKILTGRAA